VDDDDNYHEEVKVEAEMDEEEYYRVRNGLSLAQQSTNEFNLNQIDRFGMASDEEDNGEGGYDGDDDEVEDDMGLNQVQQRKLRESRYGFTRVPFDPDESSIEGDEHEVEEEVSDEECEEDFMRDFGASYLIDPKRERKWRNRASSNSRAIYFDEMDFDDEHYADADADYDILDYEHYADAWLMDMLVSAPRL
jgi:hypothetical protein